MEGRQQSSRVILEKGFVHVMSEHSFLEVMGEPDTVTDLVEYLTAKEALVARGCSVVVQGSESNLLGWYLANQRAFATDADFMIVDDTIWRGVSSSSEFLRRKEATARATSGTSSLTCFPIQTRIRSEKWEQDSAMRNLPSALWLGRTAFTVGYWASACANFLYMQLMAGYAHVFSSGQVGLYMYWCSSGPARTPSTGLLNSAHAVFARVI